MQPRLPKYCPACGSNAVIETAGIIVCTVCPAGPGQAARAQLILDSTNKRLAKQRHTRRYFAQNKRRILTH